LNDTPALRSAVQDGSILDIVLVMTVTGVAPSRDQG